MRTTCKFGYSLQESDFVQGTQRRDLRPDAIPTLHLQTSPGATPEPERLARRTRCAVVGCRPEPKAKRHIFPDKTPGGKRDPRRDLWFILCGVDPDDTRGDLRVCEKHFDPERDYNPRTGRLLRTANPSRYLPGDAVEDEEEEDADLVGLDEHMVTGEEDDPLGLPDDFVEAVSAISLVEEEDRSEGDAEESNSSSSDEESDGELEAAAGFLENMLENREGEIFELKKKLKLALQSARRARRKSDRAEPPKMPRKKDVEKYLRQNYSHSWDVLIVPILIKSYTVQTL